MQKPKPFSDLAKTFETTMLSALHEVLKTRDDTELTPFREDLASVISIADAVKTALTDLILAEFESQFTGQDGTELTEGYNEMLEQLEKAAKEAS